MNHPADYVRGTIDFIKIWLHINQFLKLISSKIACHKWNFGLTNDQLGRHFKCAVDTQ